MIFEFYGSFFTALLDVWAWLFGHMLFWVYYMHVFYSFVRALVQRSWACFTWKDALEIHYYYLSAWLLSTKNYLLPTVTTQWPVLLQFRVWDDRGCAHHSSQILLLWVLSCTQSTWSSGIVSTIHNPLHLSLYTVNNQLFHSDLCPLPLHQACCGCKSLWHDQCGHTLSQCQEVTLWPWPYKWKGGCWHCR